MAKSQAFKRFKDQPDEAPEIGRSPLMCCVNGCPLVAPHRLSDGSSMCYVHYGTRAEHWADITTKIRNRVDLFNLAREMLNESPGAKIPQYALDAIREGDQPPDDVRHARSFGAWLEGRLMAKCRPVDKMPAEVLEVAKGFKRVGSLV